MLFGAVFGAILGPAVFGPLFAGSELDAAALTVPWLAAAGISLIALGVVLCVRPDPKRIGELLGGDDRPPSRPPSRCGRSSRRPGVKPAMLAAIASFAVMVSVMNLSGYVVVEHHHHHQSDVFLIIGAHVLGMYALVLVVGALIDRIGRPIALAAGLLVMARLARSGCSGFESVAADRGAAVRARDRLEPVVRGRDRAARRPHRAERARAPDRLQRPALGAVRARRWRCSAATRSTRSASRRWRSARRRSSPRRCSCSAPPPQPLRVISIDSSRKSARPTTIGAAVSCRP